MQVFTRGVGSLSSSHDLFGAAMMSRRISASVAGRSTSRTGVSGLLGAPVSSDVCLETKHGWL